MFYKYSEYDKRLLILLPAEMVKNSIPYKWLKFLITNNSSNLLQKLTFRSIILAANKSLSNLNICFRTLFIRRINSSHKKLHLNRILVSSSQENIVVVAAINNRITRENKPG